MPIPQPPLTQVPDGEDNAMQVEHFRRGGQLWTRVSVRTAEGPFVTREWPRNSVLGALSATQHNAFLLAQRAAFFAAVGGTDS